MDLSIDQLNAFYAVSRTKSFTKAGLELGLTQSALSHRIKSLEQRLEKALFIRESSGIRITEAGMRLLEFCRVQAQMEAELLGDLQNESQAGLNGYLRIGGASTILWSAVAPALSPLLNQHTQVQIEMIERELKELPGLLQSGAVDFIVTCGKFERSSFEEHLLGEEINVLAQSKKKSNRTDTYIDHHPEDETTSNYLKLQGLRKPQFKRSYMDNIQGILSGVEAGLGKAVLPRHLLKANKNIEVVKNQKEMPVPVYIYYLRQPYYSRLHEATVKALTDNVGAHLKF